MPLIILLVYQGGGGMGGGGGNPFGGGPMDFGKSKSKFQEVPETGVKFADVAVSTPLSSGQAQPACVCQRHHMPFGVRDSWPGCLVPVPNGLPPNGHLLATRFYTAHIAQCVIA